MKEQIQPVTEFLAEQVYLPGYMCLATQDYDQNGATFTFNVREPPVARGDIVHYVTPRGLHICISQAGYALAEHLAEEGRLGDLTLENLRKTLLTGRVKIREIYEKFRKELLLKDPIQARFNVDRLRTGNPSLMKLVFSFQNLAIEGFFSSAIAPEPVISLNTGVTIF